MWATDEIVILGSAILGDLTVIGTRSRSVDLPEVVDGYLTGTNSVRTAVVSLSMDSNDDVVEHVYSTFVSPAALPLSLGEALALGLEFVHPVPQELASTPPLNELKDMFDAIQAGMELPDGVTPDMINEEAEHFYAAMAGPPEGKMTLAERLKTQWGQGHYHALDATFVKWYGHEEGYRSHLSNEAAPRASKAEAKPSAGGNADGDAAAAPDELTDAFFEALLGKAQAQVLSGVIQRLGSIGLSLEGADATTLVEDFNSAIAAVLTQNVESAISVQGDRVPSDLEDISVEALVEAFLEGEEEEEDGDD
eukprot:NODE_10260_length_1365_cov_5.899838.p1 GENE.NODE_10260_length_1365_cov_5.899838~~NODE_10260_length_1365_cov_5.899838.p1  ORF type:complete len:308 (-),score=120.43 NODE_10260_length_1365_cov_5.899838:257-1180(-)